MAKTGVMILMRECSKCKNDFPKSKELKGKKCPYCKRVDADPDKVRYFVYYND